MDKRTRVADTGDTTTLNTDGPETNTMLLGIGIEPTNTLLNTDDDWIADIEVADFDGEYASISTMLSVYVSDPSVDFDTDTLDI